MAWHKVQNQPAGPWAQHAPISNSQSRPSTCLPIQWPTSIFPFPYNPHSSPPHTLSVFTSSFSFTTDSTFTNISISFPLFSSLSLCFSLSLQNHASQDSSIVFSLEPTCGNSVSSATTIFVFIFSSELFGCSGFFEPAFLSSQKRHKLCVVCFKRWCE